MKDNYIIKCTKCNGTGYYETIEDLHNSGGVIKCTKCHNGYISQTEQDRISKIHEEYKIRHKEYLKTPEGIDWLNRVESAKKYLADISKTNLAKKMQSGFEF